jgi:hypothetical protein
MEPLLRVVKKRRWLTDLSIKHLSAEELTEPSNEILIFLSWKILIMRADSSILEKNNLE